MFVTESNGIRATGKTKREADCNWTALMDERNRARELDELINFVRSSPAATVRAALSREAARFPNRTARRLALAGHAGTTTASHTAAPSNLFWFDDVSVVECGVLRRATPQEVSQRYD